MVRINFILNHLFLINIIINKKVNYSFSYYCDDNPCKNGYCIELIETNSFRCKCFNGWTGALCDKSNFYFITMIIKILLNDLKI
jgi:hypothetical protein